jgi:DNA-directed RNA polymerase beta' subunit
MDEIFIDKFLVSPAFYRDYNPSKLSGDNGVKVDEVNKLYTKLIMLSKSINPDDSAYSFSGLTTQASMQTVLNDIYSFYVKDKLSKKTGHIHQAMLGHTVDYSTRGVISTELFSSKKYEDSQIPFGYTGIPLTMIVVLFKPYFVKWIQDFVLQYEHDVKIIKKGHKEAEDSDVTKEINLRELFDEELITRLLGLFISSSESRFQPLSVTDNKGNIYQLDMLETQLHRDFTLIDMLYLAAEDICKDKHVYVTRFPVENFQNIYPSRIKIITTKETQTVQIEDKYFKNYPKVIPNYPDSDSVLIQTIVMNSMYLERLGADFDGDTVSIRSVYSVEANKEAEMIMKKKSYAIRQDGKNSRHIGNEAIQAIYSITKD